MYSRLKGQASMANGDAHQFHRAPVPAEGCDQRLLFCVFFVTFLHAAQVSADPNFNEKQCAFTTADVCRGWVGEVWDASGVDQFQGCPFAFVYQRLKFGGGEDPLRNVIRCGGALPVMVVGLLLVK